MMLVNILLLYFYYIGNSRGMGEIERDITVNRELGVVFWPVLDADHAYAVLLIELCSLSGSVSTRATVPVRFRPVWV
jgi:hypothetical protein